MASNTNNKVNSTTADPKAKSQPVGNVASVKGTVKSDWLKVVRAEERSHLFEDLIKEGLGTDDVENFVAKQMAMRVCRKDGEGYGKARERVKEHMVDKLEDSWLDEKVKRAERNNQRSKLEHLLRKRKSEYKKYINFVKGIMRNERAMLRRENMKKVRKIRINRKEIKEFKLPPNLARYSEAEIFKEESRCQFVPGEVKGPVIVGGDPRLLSPNEVAVLTRGPKFTVRRVLDKERYLLELEKASVKLRWHLKDKDLMEEVDMETLMNEEEKQAVDEIAQVEEAKSRSVFSHDDMKVDFRRSRATDVKHNTKINLPGPLTNIQEAEIGMRRIAFGAVFDKFVDGFKDEKGVTEDNLTKEEAAGLKSLKRRVADGSLVICQTDKSGRFAVMSMEEYEMAGLKHTSKDQEVDIDSVKAIETQLNGHISMMLKMFNVGANWGHEDRTRATKITHSLSVAPLYLLYKDHKGWSVQMGGAPPSRPVASAGSGQNDHYSEMASQLLEPVANQWKGGMEAQSTPDMVHLVEELNDGDLELESIDLEEIDRELDNLDRVANNENEKEASDTLVGHRPQNVPDKIKTTAKQDVEAQQYQFKISAIKMRWENNARYKGKSVAGNILETIWEGKSKPVEICNNLIDYLYSRNDDQVLEDAWEMLEEYDKVWEVHGGEDGFEEILTRIIELFLELAAANNIDGECREHYEGQSQTHNCESPMLEGVHDDGNYLVAGVHVQVQGVNDNEDDEQVQGDDGQVMQNTVLPVEEVQHEGVRGGVHSDCGGQHGEQPVAGDGEQGVHQPGDQHEGGHGGVRIEMMKRIRESRRMATAARKKLEFQPVMEVDLTVTQKTEPKTKKGRKLLEAMMVNKKLIQDGASNMVVVGADVEALYPSLADTQVAEIVYKAVMKQMLALRE